MSQQHMDALARDLERQGCRVKRTAGGYFCYCPDGTSTIGFHTSNHSDRRAMRNIHAAVKRAGLIWPKGLPG